MKKNPVIQLIKTSALQGAIFNSRNFSSIATDAHGVIQIFNVGAETMLGFTATEVMNIMTPADLSDQAELNARAESLSLEFGEIIHSGFEALVYKAARGMEDIYELTYLCKNGSRLAALVSVTALRDHEQNIIGYLLIGTDNTARKQAENSNRIAAVAFESAHSMFVTDAKGFFIHINHAFSEMSGYSMSDLVGKKPNILKSGRQTDEFYKAMWQTVNAAGTWSGELWNKRKNGEIYLEFVNILAVVDEQGNITNYVANYTDISQLKAYEVGLIEAKEKAERFSTLKTQFIKSLPFKVLDLLNTISRLFSGSAQQKGLAFTIERDSTIPLELLGDKLRLQQVLTNLVGNAIKFTAHGTVKLEITLQAMTSSQVQLLFCVTDSGIGISLDDQDKLFKEFSQVDGSFSRQYGGTGLGLVISKELVELMGGEISVVSGAGQGSAFSFAVQLGVINESIGYTTQLTAISPKVPSQLTANKLKGYRILIVEDNAFSQKLIQKHLASLGIDTLLAQHGEEALILLEEHDFDAILMDIHMPIMNGIEATQRIRQQAKFATLPIIALSAGVTDTERNNCIACGMVGFVSKPINVEQLCAVLELWLKPKA